jgi:CMP-N,N'-diacetyllegionaminic acid synthase
MKSTRPILGIIPARAGSKRLPGKNLLPLGGKPLAQHIIDAALGTKQIDHWIVSSDDTDVLDLAAKNDGLETIVRPDHLATDTSMAIDYVRHALSHCESSGKPRFETVVIVQVTSPFTTSEDIDSTVRLLDKSGADSAVSVSEVAFDVHPAKLKLMEGDQLRPYLEDEEGRMASHQLPKVYARNGSVYASLRHVFDEGLIIGQDCRGYIMPRERAVDVNDPLDYEFACFLHQRHG